MALKIDFTTFADFYAHNFEEVEGACWFDPVRLSVTLSCGHDIFRTVEDMELIFGLQYPYHIKDVLIHLKAECIKYY